MPVIDTLTVGPLACNCVLLAGAGSRDAVVVDPGGDAPRILRRLRDLGLEARWLLHTHAHADHMGATGELARATGATVALHPADRFLWDRFAFQLAMLGLSAPPAPPPDHHLADGEEISCGGLRLRVIALPGHSPGGVGFLVDGDTLLAGDTLFAGGVGRCDLPGGDGPLLARSIRERLFPLPPATRVVCGHGPDTTIGDERRSNPFVSP